MKYLSPLILATITFYVAGCAAPSAAEKGQTMKRQFTLYPIGRVAKEDGKTMIVLDKEYQPGLLGLERHSHVTVVYWFDRNDTAEKRAILKVHPQGNMKNPLTGVFATHSPVRPNLIAISRCKIVGIRQNVVEIESIDAFDDSPVLDLKGDYFAFNRPQQRH